MKYKNEEGKTVDFKLDPAVKKRWTDALRSGEYPQGSNQLKTNDGYFCCLGVKAEIEGKLTKAKYTVYPGRPETTYEEKEKYGLFNWFTRTVTRTLPARPDRVQEGTWRCGSIMGHLPENEMPSEIQAKLINMNDTEGRSFNYIAAYIDRYL